MSHPERDAELDAWLARSSTLHEQLARLDRADPPEELDRIILDRAREAIRSPPVVRPLRHLRWALPVGLAATLLLSFALVLQLAPPPEETPTAPLSKAQERVVYDDATASYESARDERAAEPSAIAQPIEIAPPEPRAVTRPRPEPGSEPAAPAAPVTELVATRARAMTEVRARKADEAAALREDPDAWLAEIARLRTEGLIEEAERELAEFKRAHPGRSTTPAAAAAARPDDR